MDAVTGMDRRRYRYKYTRLQNVGTWAWDDLCWLSFFSLVWSWRSVVFQLSGLYCIVMYLYVDIDTHIDI